MPVIIDATRPSRDANTIGIASMITAKMTVAKIANKCHAYGSKPMGTGINQMVSPSSRQQKRLALVVNPGISSVGNVAEHTVS